MKTNDVSLLHPDFRARSLDLAKRVETAHLPIMRYEGWRDPSRQADLWAFGRASGIGTPGHHKTFEMAWQSSHQWGFAEDWVWWFNGAWSWAPPPGQTWDAFFALALAAGLEHLKFEEPHVQLPGFHGRHLLDGSLTLPPGDATWQANIEAAMTAWGPLPRKDRYGIEQPGVPNLLDPRPAAPVPPGAVYDEERGLCLDSSRENDEDAPDVTSPQEA
jgi:hypothetical protein